MAQAVTAIVSPAKARQFRLGVRERGWRMELNLVLYAKRFPSLDPPQSVRKPDRMGWQAGSAGVTLFARSEQRTIFRTEGLATENASGSSGGSEFSIAVSGHSASKSSVLPPLHHVAVGDHSAAQPRPDHRR